MNEIQNKGSWGGQRTGSGRKLQPRQKVMRNLKRYLEVSLLSDFKLMAHLALRPEEFADQVQFAGKEEDSLDKEGKQSQSRTGAYALDPLFKERLALLKFRIQKFLPDPPREVEVNGEMEIHGLPPQVIQILMQPVQALISHEKSKSIDCVTPSTSHEPIALNDSTHGKQDSSPNVNPLDLLR